MSHPDDDTLELLAARISSIYGDMSDEVVEVIARRLKDIGELSTTDAYTLARLAEAGDMAEITALMTKYTGYAERELKTVYETLATINDDWASVYYEYANVPYSGWASNAITRATVYQAYNAQAQSLINLSHTAAFSYGGTVKTIQAAYLDSVNKAILAVSTGVKDYRTAIRKTVRDLSASGLREVSYAPGSRAEALAAKGVLSVEYPSGRTLRIDSAVRMNTMDGFRSTVNTMRDQQGSEFGADGVEVSAHALCAPDHQEIQGHQYYNEEWYQINASLERHLSTCNCKHITFPVIVGVSTPTYTDEQLQGFIDSSNERVTWTGLSGKEMSVTRYEATQYQRNLEANLRTKKSEAKAFAAAGDVEEARRCTAQARALQKSYNEISEQMGLSTKPWRTTAGKQVPIPADTAKATATPTYSRSSLKQLNRKDLETLASSAFIKNNPSLTLAEALRRSEALMDGNTTAQLIDYVYKNKGVL